MRQWLAAGLFWVVVLAGSWVEARGRCPAGFSPERGAGCVQDDCREIGGILDGQLRCACGESKACTAEVTYTRRARARCKDACPETRIVACVPLDRPCPGEQTTPCEQDSDCPPCTYCDGKQCARATALIATGPLPDRRRGKGGKVDWHGSRVTFWAEKAWAARYLLLKGCRLAFADVEDGEELAEKLADAEVRALAFFGPCTADALRAVKVERGSGDIFGNKGAAAQERHQSTLAGMTADELRDATRTALEKQLRRQRRPRMSRKQAREAAETRTREGWLHFLINGTCHGLDDTGLADGLLRPGGVCFGREGAARPGLPLKRHERGGK